MQSCKHSILGLMDFKDRVLFMFVDSQPAVPHQIALHLLFSDPSHSVNKCFTFFIIHQFIKCWKLPALGGLYLQIHHSNVERTWHIILKIYMPSYKDPKCSIDENRFMTCVVKCCQKLVETISANGGLQATAFSHCEMKE